MANKEIMVLGTNERVKELDIFTYVGYLAVKLAEEVKKLEEAKKVPYVTSFERIGIKKGLQQGLLQGLLEDGREMILEALDERFGEVPSNVSNVVDRIGERDTLKSLHRHTIRCASLEEFKESLN